MMTSSDTPLLADDELKAYELMDALERAAGQRDLAVSTVVWLGVLSLEHNEVALSLCLSGMHGEIVVIQDSHGVFWLTSHRTGHACDIAERIRQDDDIDGLVHRCLDVLMETSLSKPNACLMH